MYRTHHNRARKANAMNLRNRLIATVGATALLVSTAVTGFAATDADATVSITEQAGAALSVSISNTSFGSIQYSFADSAPLPGTLNLSASDTRGTASGWNVSLKATDFDGATTSDSIPVGQLSLAAGSVTTTSGNNNTTSPNQGVFALATVQTGDQKVWNAQAGFGDGQYTLAVPGSLVVPGGTLVDTYTSLVTVSITSGP
jgi:hypothetical protein